MEQKQNLPAVIETAIQHQKIDLNNVNFLLPTQTFGQVIGEYDKIVIEVVKIDPDEDAFEVASGKFSPGKRPLMAISNALGIVWDPKTTTIVESTERRSRAKATGAMRKPNGEWVVISEEKTVDIDVIEEEQRISNEERAEKGDQDNAEWKTSSSGKKYPVFPPWKSDAEKKHWIAKATRRAVLQYRKFKDERAMTGAKERVIRQFVALKNTYTREELSRPFAFPRVIPDIEKMLQHPEVRKNAIEKMTGAVTSIFGPSPAAREPQSSAPPAYRILENKGDVGEESPKEPEPTIPWETETEEQKEIHLCLEELKKLSEVEYLHSDAKKMAKEELQKESHTLEALNALIDRIKDWLKKYEDSQKEGTHAKAN